MTAFDDALDQSLAITQGVTPAIRVQFEEVARAVGRDTRFSAEEAAEGFFFLASTGLDAAAQLQALPVLAEFAQAYNFDLVTATGLLASATTVRDHDRWGPNGLHVEQIIRRAATMSADECRRLASAWDAWTAPDPAEGPLDFGDTDPWQAASDEWNDAEEALDRAVTAAGRAEEVRDAGRAGWDAVRHTDPAGRVAAPLAADTAATAVAAVGLVGTEGFTAAHFDLLLGPWRSVFGAEGEPVCECGRES